MIRLRPFFSRKWEIMGLVAVVGFWAELLAVERLRLSNVFYVEDHLEKPLELKALRKTLITFSRDGSGLLDTLRAGQHARLVGIGKDRYLIKTMTLNGRVEGWVVASDMEPIPEAIVKELDQKSKEAEKLRQAIEKKEVEIGMPQDAVIKILGKPKAKSSIKDAAGSFEQWTYTTYKNVPFYLPSNIGGTNFIATVYRKAPVGTKVITFQEKKVIRFETKEEETPPSQGGPIVIPPVYVQ